MRGYFGIGVFHAKTKQNIGTLLRSAEAFGAAFVFTVGPRFWKQASDVWASWRRLPVYQYDDVTLLRASLPYSCPLIGVELDGRAVPLSRFAFPQRGCYVLGAEDHGLSESVRRECHALVQIPNATGCLNVAVAGSILMYALRQDAAESAQKAVSA